MVDKEFSFEIGQEYQTLLGDKVKVLRRAGRKGHEYVSCSDGLHRYDRSNGNGSDNGRVTSANPDLTDGRSFKPLEKIAVSPIEPVSRTRTEYQCNRGDWHSSLEELRVANSQMRIEEFVDEADEILSRTNLDEWLCGNAEKLGALLSELTHCQAALDQYNKELARRGMADESR